MRMLSNWGSDDFVFWFVLVLVALVLAFLLERVSPGRKARRKSRGRSGTGGRGPRDDKDLII
jgi:hypothetical protein